MAMFPFIKTEEDDNLLQEIPQSPSYEDSIRGIAGYQPEEAPMASTSPDITTAPTAPTAPTKLADLLPAKAETDTSKTPEAPMSAQDKLLKEYLQLFGKDTTDELKSARDRDRMLKIGGSIGDALATYINAQGQMNAKVPGVQVQQGAGLGKVADMFATAPEIQSDIATRREALMNQYKQLAMQQMSEAKRESAAKIAENRNKTILEAAQIGASGRSDLAEIGRENKKNELIDKNTIKLKSDLTESQAVATTISNVEKLLGFNLDDVDLETGTVKGKPVDIPGVNIPGKGRTTFYSSAARELDDTMSNLFNVELKNRSGVSVTPPELQALKKEFSEGKFNTEEEKLKALKRFKQALKTAFRNIEAGYSKEVISEYQDRGGFTSDRLGKTSEKTTKKAAAGDIVTVKGKKYKVAEDGDSLIPVGQ